ncbi:hypothetical protein EB796_019133 [Bugula neritina]|uniref:CFAP97 n=1 Tax=Bugula neritina TaxID=10212 RepID=A0A7J7J8L5_BUGNE|nr:hypothetical protein EB796_019133 [Bugula neritina]
MSYIMRTQGRVDNRNNYEYKSLNREKRQRELLRVTRENQAVLQRILNRKPEYHRSQWQKDWENNLKFMDSISAYPRTGGTRKKTRKLRQPHPGMMTKAEKMRLKVSTVLRLRDEQRCGISNDALVTREYIQ